VVVIAELVVISVVVVLDSVVVSIADDDFVLTMGKVGVAVVAVLLLVYLFRDEENVRRPLQTRTFLCSFQQSWSYLWSSQVSWSYL
jgi:hypothetical protein